MRKSIFVQASLPASLTAAASTVLCRVGSSSLNNWAVYGVNINSWCVQGLAGGLFNL